MPRRIVTFLLLSAVFSSSGALFAQAAPNGRSFGYVFVSPVFVPTSPFTRWDGTFLIAGLAGEAAIGRHVTAGGEAALVAPVTNAFSRNAAMVTAGASYHISGSGSRFDPFLSGGAGSLVPAGYGALGYLGGGATWWFRDHFGFRSDFRYHFYRSGDGNIDLVGVRFGLSFR